PSPLSLVIFPPPPRSTLFPYTTLFRSTADSSRAGRVTYQVLSPNAVSGTRTWAAATGCQTGTTTSAPASPAFTLGQPSVSPSTFAGDCATASFTLNGTVTVTSPPGGLTLTYAVLE